MRRPHKLAIACVSVAALCAPLWLLRRHFLLITVEGASMAPTYLPGDRLLVRRTSRFTRDQAVIFAATAGEIPPTRTLTSEVTWIVKRAIAIPGDELPRAQVPALFGAAEETVPPGFLIVLGDNPDDSYDSRHYGYISTERIHGRVIRHIPSP